MAPPEIQQVAKTVADSLCWGAWILFCPDFESSEIWEDSFFKWRVWVTVGADPVCRKSGNTSSMLVA